MIRLYYCIVSLFIVSIGYNLNGQTLNKENKNLEFKGEIKTHNASDLDLVDCIVNSSTLMGVTSYSNSEAEDKEPASVIGDYGYTYYVDDYEKLAGYVSFKYKFDINKGLISYIFYDFEHDGEDTEFESLGLLTTSWNEGNTKVFTENQYLEILKDIVGNTVNVIRMIKSYCVN